VTLVGVLGGGQLGRMLALAGLPLGLRFRFLDPSPRPTAAALGEHVQAAYDDPDALARFVDGLDVVTFEFERVPVETVEWLANHVPVRPGARSLRVCGDRVVEKRFARLSGAPTAPFAEVDDLASLERAVREVGTPAILKTRRDGYDGKGQVRVHEPAAAEAAWRSLGSCPCVLEGFVPFTRELAVLAVRDLRGEVRTWPLVETRHADGILVSAVAPAPRVDEALQAQAQRLAERVTRELDQSDDDDDDDAGCCAAGPSSSAAAAAKPATPTASSSKSRYDALLRWAERLLLRLRSWLARVVDWAADEFDPWIKWVVLDALFAVVTAAVARRVGAVRPLFEAFGWT